MLANGLLYSWGEKGSSLGRPAKNKVIWGFIEGRSNDS